MNVNSITSMSQMAYKASTLKKDENLSSQSSSDQIKQFVDKFGSNSVNNTNNNVSTLLGNSNSSNSINDSFEVTISQKAQKELAKQQAILKQKQEALKSIETTTTALQDSAVAMSKNDYSDANGTVKNLQSFIESYNKNLTTAGKYSKIENTSASLKVDMQQARYQSRFYASIGINVSQNGALSLDEDKFKEALAADKDKVGNLVGGSSGLVAKTAAVTDEYLGTTTVLNTYHAGSGNISTNGSHTVDSANDTTAANSYETALVSSLSTLKDSTLTLWNADLEQSDDAAIKDAVKQFTADYSGVVKTLQSYKNEYYSAESIGIDFAEPRFMSKIYSSIGINVANNGSMSVNDEALQDALTNNRDKVIELLQGDNGLLSKTGGLIGGLIS